MVKGDVIRSLFENSKSITKTKGVQGIVERDIRVQITHKKHREPHSEKSTYNRYDKTRRLFKLASSREKFQAKEGTPTAH